MGARRLYVRGGTGVRGFAKVYGSAQSRRGTRQHFRRASRGLIRYGLQQLESQKLVQAGKEGGRYLSKTGRKQLDQVAGTVDAPKPFAFIPRDEAEAEEAVEDTFEDQDQDD